MTTEREIISAFSDYVEANVRDDDNPCISVRQTDAESHKYVIVALDGVDNGNREFLAKIEDFRAGTKCRIKHAVEHDGAIFSVMIPFRGPVSARKNDREGAQQPCRANPPNVSRLLCAVILLMATIGVGITTTDKSEWFGIF